MTHREMYKRDANPHLGLLLNDRRTERDAGEMTEEEKVVGCSERKMVLEHTGMFRSVTI